MPFIRQRAELTLSPELQERIEQISKSRTESSSRVERAKMVLAYARRTPVSAIARELSTSRPRVERCIDKALQLGVLTALDDLPRPGKPTLITPESRAWLISVACRKPKEFGYPYELWTNRLLAKHARQHCEAAGHPSLSRINRGTVSKILSKSDVRPHKVVYYLERRDPEFDHKMAQVLHVYKEVQLLQQQKADVPPVATISYDEKPGIQAIANVTPDLPPIPGQHPAIGRDHDYKRLGTVSLLAGIDLLTGQVQGIVADRHRSREFIEYLKILDGLYPKQITIRLVLDNHSAHISKETRRFLASVPQRFEFIFTPKHGSWLNIIESLFAKMAKTLLRAIRVDTKNELKERIQQWLQEINESPVIFKWKYGLDSISLK